MPANCFKVLREVDLPAVRISDLNGHRAYRARKSPIFQCFFKVVMVANSMKLLDEHGKVALSDNLQPQ